MKHLSRLDIEAIADKYVQAYMALPDVRNTQVYRIDPELLLEKVLGLNVEYQHLSYDGSILGLTSFSEMGVQVFEDDDNDAFFFLDGKTVLVEKDLSREWIWKMTSHYDCPFVLRLGHRRLVKRRAFDEYIKRFDFIE